MHLSENERVKGEKKNPRTLHYTNNNPQTKHVPMISVALKVKEHLRLHERNNARVEQQDLLKRGRIQRVGLGSITTKAAIGRVQMPEFGLVEVVLA